MKHLRSSIFAASSSSGDPPASFSLASALVANAKEYRSSQGPFSSSRLFRCGETKGWGPGDRVSGVQGSRMRAMMMGTWGWGEGKWVAWE